jgi:peptidoglycan/xylan/chitin deacetylase (PgdA/CDA1 family)
MIDEIKKDKELWSLFTRQEEYYPTYLDKHGRFLYYMSANREVMKPSVSEFLVNHGLRQEYGDGHKFAVCLTHDIDAIYLPWSSVAHDVLNNVMDGKVAKALALPWSRIRKDRNPLWNFQDILRLEEKYGATSTFFIMTARPGPHNQIYQIGDLKYELRDILDRGWDIGLHGGYQTYDDPTLIAEEKRVLEQSTGKKIVGYRNHFMRFKTPETWRFLEKAGFLYDATLGYVDHVGFRNGMCHAFQPYDLSENRPINIIEIPLAVQDSTLSNYMGLDYDSSFYLIKQLIDRVEKCRGVITLLWHNSMLTGKNFDFYEKILKFCREKQAYMTNAYDISKYAVLLR